MRITQTRDKSITQYMLDKPLKDLESFKDLGVMVSKVSHGIIILA